MKRSIIAVSAAWAALGVAAMLAACGGGSHGPKSVPDPSARQAAATRGDWYTYRHDNRRTGCSGVVGPQHPRILWSVPGKGPVVFDSRGTAYLFYFGEQEETVNSVAAVKEGRVTRLLDADKADYETTCAVHLDGSVYTGMWWQNAKRPRPVRRFGHSGSLLWGVDLATVGIPLILPDGSCCLNGELSEDEASILCFNADGSLRWNIPWSTYNYTMSVALDGGILGTSTADDQSGDTYFRLFRLDPRTGLPVWEWRSDSTPNHFDAAPSSAVVLTDGSMVVVDGRGVYRFSANGDLLWMRRLGSENEQQVRHQVPGGRQYPPAVSSDGTVYVTLLDNIRRYGEALVAISPEGDLLWQRDEHFQGAPIVDAAGTVYITSGYRLPHHLILIHTSSPSGEPRNLILAINADGTTKWEFSAPDELEVGTVWCMDNEGNLVVSGRIPGDGYWDERFFWIGDG